MTPQNKDAINQTLIELFPTVLGVLFGLLSVGFAFFLGKLLFSEMDLAELAGLMSLPIIAASAGIALWGHWKKIQFDKSKAYVDKASELMEQARSVLFEPQDQLTNNRICWVTSARLLKHAQQIKSLITVDAHKKIFDSEHDYQRHLFGEMLLHKQDEIPASFFLGAEYKGLTLGEAACSESQERDAGKWIPVRIVSEVFRFFSYPFDYEDPLDDATELSPDEVGQLWLTGGQQLCDYLTFRQNFIRAGWKVHKHSEPGKRCDLDAEDIDGEMGALSGTYKDPSG